MLIVSIAIGILPLAIFLFLTRNYKVNNNRNYYPPSNDVKVQFELYNQTQLMKEHIFNCKHGMYSVNSNLENYHVPHSVQRPNDRFYP